ncbi:glycogen debranching enzyme [Penicillium brasilianum]|uniref:Glycogen debranching enzyme n=1 Tax=Penicillium brasilianum TaxID=104259 RepID=A0A1S9RHG1_PENBI|nr:glycogen debranching enzyme [Penicillium brasilianum]
MNKLLKLSLFGSLVAAAAQSGDAFLPSQRSQRLHARSSAPKCNTTASTLSLSDPPYDNYFYSDCNVAAQAVVTSPLPQSNLSIIGPRLIVAWPAGNSGVCAYFAPQNGANGTLSIKMVNSTVGQPLGPVYTAGSNSSANPSVGVQGVLRFNSSATLTVPILGSIRTIRDFVEGPSLLHSEIQDAIQFIAHDNGSASLQRTWLDNVTSTSFTFTPYPNGTSGNVTVSNRTLSFTAGDYLVSASMNYPQLTALKSSSVLNSASSNLTTTNQGQVDALSFLSYSEKLLAGAWRFLTYFGRDSMISALLLEPVLSSGNGSAMEAVIGAVLERVNRTDGSVCHEETIGDYATWTNLQNNITSNAMVCDYKMVDTDYYLPVLMQKYFLDNPVGQKRAAAFFNTSAGLINAENQNLTWGDLALISAERVMRLARPFAENQTKANLVHLKDGQVVGEWRDSEFGIGGGRIPYDVNTALIPAALRSIAVLARQGIYSKHKQWSNLATKYAQVWEDKTLDFFKVSIPQAKAQELVASYKNQSSFSGPDQAASITEDVVFHALALDGNNNLTKVEVMNTDDCFRHFLLNATDDTQLTPFLNNSATNIRRTFPAGLMTSASMIVANPALGGDPVYAQNWTTGAYHGTVIWSWQLAMMAKGLELQLGRCELSANFSVSGGHGQAKKKEETVAPIPDFCGDDSVYGNVKAAYNELWDSIEQNESQLSGEVWSWVYRDGDFQVTPLGVLPAPGGGSQTESDIRQLWSLTFLAVTRNKAYQ